MASSERLLAGLCLWCAWTPVASAQQLQGFAVDRFYQSAPGAGWFIMDDLNIEGRLGGAVALTGGYSRNPLVLRSADGTQKLAVVSNEAFVDLGAAVTYSRFRLYFNLPMPIIVSGNSGMIGGLQVTAPSVNIATNPDTVSDVRVGFDARLFGKPGSLLRLGAGAQVIIPSGGRADFVTDRRYRGMFRLLAAGDAGRFVYAGQVGVHVRPGGNEFLFGIGAGRKYSVHDGWALIVGPEFYGQTAVRSGVSGQYGSEVLLTGRMEMTGDRPHLRLKAGVGHGVSEHFGSPEWRAVLGVELTSGSH